jgi:hypothetical protein
MKQVDVESHLCAQCSEEFEWDEWDEQHNSANLC